MCNAVLMMAALSQPRLFGAAYSVYVRAVRLALEEKGVPYELIPIDIFAPGGPPADYASRHPFLRIPAFEWNGFRLYETAAIMRFVDEGFEGPPLQPDDAAARARMQQVMSILDSYAYRTLVWGIYFERVEATLRGRRPDETRIKAALPRAAVCLNALDELLEGRDWFGGARRSLADLLALPMFAYFLLAQEAQPLMTPRARLQAWWTRASALPSVARTRPKLPDASHARMA
jgi:glutathione S-transferase